MHSRARDAAVGIVRALREAGYEAYLAGGCVRDELLGLAPHDYDVATSAPPDDVQRVFARTREVGKAFAVVQVRFGGVWTEVATFRAEGTYTDRRRPDSIRLTDAREDALRRDFTINALFLDPLEVSTDERGRVVDYVGGVGDLEAGLVRAVGDPAARLAEDHLRALRAVRFAARLGFAVERATGEAVRAHASSLDGVSRERVGEECRKMLGHAHRAHAVALMHELGLDGPALGQASVGSIEVVALAGVGAGSDAAAGLSAGLLDRAGGDASDAAGSGGVATRSMCLSNEERADVQEMVGLVATIGGAWVGLGVAGRKRAASRGRFGESLAMVAARDPQLGKDVRVAVESLASDGVGLAPVPLVTGDTLIARGLEPGPKFGEWLERVYDAQLEGRVREPEAAAALVLSWASSVDE
ncbi:MAG: CCA tRNA nucleotidyltransferase [Planctomycetota bacterium]